MKRRLSLCFALALTSSLILFSGCAALNALATPAAPGAGGSVGPTTQPDNVDKVANAIENGIGLGEKLAKPAQDAGIPYAGLAYAGLVAVGSIVSGIVALRHGNQQTDKFAQLAQSSLAAVPPIVLPAPAAAGAG